MFGYAYNQPTGERGRHGHHGRHGGPRGRRFDPRWEGPGGGGFGFGGFGPGYGPRGRGRKARRGDIRTAALLLLAEEPRNGYQIMQEVEERSDGVWRPSPGSVYPALAQLEDEGLIRTETDDGRKLLQITDAGRKVLQERGEDRPAPWEEAAGDLGDQYRDLARTMHQAAGAFAQVMRTGSPDQIAKAREVLDRTRRDLYGILADGESEPGTVNDEK
jgi:DNA-binding PadR family transcriptional regulator